MYNCAGQNIEEEEEDAEEEEMKDS
jgi:hypothetical protein